MSSAIVNINDISDCNRIENSLYFSLREVLVSYSERHNLSVGQMIGTLESLKMDIYNGE